MLVIVSEQIEVLWTYLPARFFNTRNISL